MKLYGKLMVSVRKNTEKFFLQFYSQVLCKYSKGEPSSFSSNKNLGEKMVKGNADLDFWFHY